MGYLNRPRRGERAWSTKHLGLILGLDPHTTMRGKPAPNAEYRRFIQSTAPNRKLIPGKHALVLDATLSRSMAGLR